MQRKMYVTIILVCVLIICLIAQSENLDVETEPVYEEAMNINGEIEEKETSIEVTALEQVETIMVAEKELFLLEEETMIMPLVITPKNADLSEIKLAVRERDIVAVRSNFNQEEPNIEVTGLGKGETQIFIKYGEDDKEIIKVCVDELTYTLDNLPEGYCYSSEEKIYQFKDDTYNIGNHSGNIYAWVDANDYSEDTIITLHRGDVIYAKGSDEVARNYIGQSFKTNTGKRNGGLGEEGAYWGYIYNKEFDADLSIYFYLTGIRDKSVEKVNEPCYINGEEQYSREYFERRWGRECTDGSIPSYIGTVDKGDVISFGYYEGTEYKETETVADIWAVYGVGASGYQFERTKDGYMYFVIPDDCISAYYYVYSDYPTESRYYWFYVE